MINREYKLQGDINTILCSINERLFEEDGRLSCSDVSYFDMENVSCAACVYEGGASSLSITLLSDNKNKVTLCAIALGMNRKMLIDCLDAYAEEVKLEEEVIEKPTATAIERDFVFIAETDRFFEQVVEGALKENNIEFTKRYQGGLYGLQRTRPVGGIGGLTPLAGPQHPVYIYVPQEQVQKAKEALVGFVDHLRIVARN
jgi:hypothetical protein